MNLTNRTHEVVNIMTLVRAIRKLFVIETDDLATFEKLVAFCSEDLNGIRTLILLNDESLFSENTIALVKTHDPDAILNYSKASNESLYSRFRTKIVTTNHRPRELQPFRTHLATVQEYPAVLRNMFAYQGKNLTLDDTLYAVIGASGGDKQEKDESALRTIDELCFAVNCGVVSPTFFDMREFGVFRDLRIQSVTSYSQLIDAIRNEDTFIQISTHFAGNGTTGSIWEVDHNVDRPFDDGATAVIGPANDLRALTYFWNERASNERSKIVWLPVERFEDYSDVLTDFEQYCLFEPTEPSAKLDELKKMLSLKKRLDSSTYHFPGLIFSDSFSHTQVVQRTGPQISISHPAGKLFSRMSHYMFEVRGLKEGVWPVSAALGEMFLAKHSKIASSYFGSRICRTGFATSTGQFNVFEDEDLFVNLVVPEERQMFATLFHDYNVGITETRGTKVIDRIINLLGGVDHLDIFANRDIFELLVKLTPRRTDRIVNHLLKQLPPDASDTSHGTLLRSLVDLPSLVAPKAVAADELEQHVAGGVKDKSSFYDHVEDLYRKKVLLRGKSFRCLQCDGDLWFPFENIGAVNKCYRCDHIVTIPTYRHNRALTDSFRVNELVASAVDQGVLPVLLTLHFLNEQKFIAPKYLYNCEIEVEGKPQLKGETDLIFTLGRKVGLGEIKADRGFDLPQVDKLVGLGTQVDVDVLVFSTLKPRASDEVQSLYAHLAHQQLPCLALILSEEVLFPKGESASITKLFEVRPDNTLLKGPLVV